MMLVQEARRVEVEDGTRVPTNLVQTLERLCRYDNPWESSTKRRALWQKPLAIVDLTREKAQGRLCYFVGCTTALDTRAQKMAHAFAANLTQGGVDFGTLGKKEPCCGDIGRRTGEDGLFEDQATKVSTVLQKAGVSDIATSSPHCFHTLRREIPLLMESMEPGAAAEYRVRHYVQVLDELLENGRLKMENPVHGRATYHDPCYLGRHNDVYEAPRRVIGAIKGLELIEMPRHGSSSLCCGGGGGRMWNEEFDGPVKMSHLRIEEAVATGAELLITACPLCLIMLNDACKTAGHQDTLRVVDLNELVQLACAPQRVASK